MQFAPLTISSRLAACLAVVAIVSSCADEPQPSPAPPAPRLVLLYATCSLNREYIEPYNSAVGFTPHLAAFGREAVVFERHNTEAGKSAVAFSSIYTGTQADTHGVYLQAMRMRDDVTMLSEAFAAQGYDTYFWDNHPLAKKALNFAQGVDPDRTFASYGEAGARARDTTFTAESPELRAILDRLRTDPDYRVLIIANNAVPHSPYLVSRIDQLRREYPDEAPNIAAEREARLGELYVANHRQLQHDFDNTIIRLGLDQNEVDDLIDVIETGYRVGVVELDTIFGGIVDAIDDHGLRSQSLIAFTSDHGELMFRDNALTKWAHGWELAPEVIQVPLLIRRPDPAAPPMRYPEVTRSIDLYPTLVGLSGFEVDERWALEGVDLSAALAGETNPPELLAFFHTVPPNRRVVKSMPEWPALAAYYPSSAPELMWVGVRSRDTVVIWRPDAHGAWSFAAFDLGSDPAVDRDLFDAANPQHAALAERLRVYKAGLVKHYKAPRPLDTRNDEEEMLRSLGYVQ